MILVENRTKSSSLRRFIAWFAFLLVLTSVLTHHNFGGSKGPLCVTARVLHDTAPGATGRSKFDYWIELCRKGRIYRCDDHHAFKSGDAIRFHFVPKSDGYIYIIEKKGSTGKKEVLFPSADSGNANSVRKGEEYILPSKVWLVFDQHAGTEVVSLVLSGDEIKDPDTLNSFDPEISCTDLALTHR
jgi:Domain of unknown function (DUF4384)